MSQSKGFAIKLPYLLVLCSLAVMSAPMRAQVTYPPHQDVTLAGVVSKIIAPRIFVLTTSTGASYRVLPFDGTPPSFNLGDRVRAYGTWREAMLEARNMRVLGEGEPPVPGAPPLPGRTISGWVAREPSGGQLVVHADNGFTYLVQPKSIPSFVVVGRGIRAHGAWRDGILEATSLRDLGFGGGSATGGGAAPAASAVVVHGTRLVGVLSAPPVGNEFVVRARSGKSYVVRAVGVKLPSLRAGDRVRVTGQYDGKEFIATTLRVLPPDAAPDLAAIFNNRTLTGAVATVNLPDGFVLQSANGFAMRVSGARPAGLVLAAKVRAYGTWREGVLQAENVRVLAKGDSTTWRAGTAKQISLGGTVVRSIDTITRVVRADSGFDFRLHAPAGLPTGATVGARVRAYGPWRDGVLEATGVRVVTR